MTVDTSALREILKGATPGPWNWAEDRLNAKDVAWHKRVGKKPPKNKHWFVFLQGSGGSWCEGEPHDRCDAWDHPIVFHIGWYSIKGGCISNGKPHGKDADLIVALRNSADEMLDEIDRLRAEVSALKAKDPAQ